MIKILEVSDEQRLQVLESVQAVLRTEFRDDKGEILSVQWKVNVGNNWKGMEIGHNWNKGPLEVSIQEILPTETGLPFVRLTKLMAEGSKMFYCHWRGSRTFSSKEMVDFAPDRTHQMLLEFVAELYAYRLEKIINRTATFL